MPGQSQTPPRGCAPPPTGPGLGWPPPTPHRCPSPSLASYEDALGRFACPALRGTDCWTAPRVALHRPTPQWLLRGPREGRPGWLVDDWLSRQRGHGKPGTQTGGGWCLTAPHGAEGLGQWVHTASERLALHDTWRWTPSRPCLCHQHTWRSAPRQAPAHGCVRPVRGQRRPRAASKSDLPLQATAGTTSHLPPDRG